MTFKPDTLLREPSTQPVAPLRPLTRREQIERTFSAAFSVLDDFKVKSPTEAYELGAVIAAHLRSSMPQVLTAIDTGPVPVVEVASAAHVAEIEKLRAEVALMRPVYVMAIEWGEAHREPLSTGCECSECRLVAAIDAAAPTESEAP